MMCRNLFSLTVFSVSLVLGGASLVQAQDLTGYQPPDMFGAAPKQIPVAPEAVPQPQAAPTPPANPPVYKASPVARPPADVAAEIGKVNPKPLTNALLGIDNKAGPPPMPTIANEVVPKPDMTPTAVGEKPVIAPKPVAVPKVEPKKVEAKIVEPAKTEMPKTEQPKLAAAKLVKVAILPMRKPPVPSFMRPKAPIKPPVAEVKPAKADNKAGITTEIAQAKPVAVEKVKAEAMQPAPEAAAPVTAPAPAPAAPIIAEVDSEEVVNTAPSKVEQPKIAPEKPAQAKPVPVKKTVAEPAPQATLQMLFAAGDANVGVEHQNVLTKDVITRLQADAGMRLQIIAYATAVDDSQSSARRVSLSRALAVRDFLKDAGVAPYRMDIRALGSATTAQHVDRVDLLLIPAL